MLAKVPKFEAFNSKSVYHLSFKSNMDANIVKDDLGALGIVAEAIVYDDRITILPEPFQGPIASDGVDIRTAPPNGASYQLLGGDGTVANQWAAPPTDPVFSVPNSAGTSTYPGNDKEYYHFNRHSFFKAWQFYQSKKGSLSTPKVAVIEVDDSPTSENRFKTNLNDPINYDTINARSFSTSITGGLETVTGGSAWSTTGTTTHATQVASMIGAAKSNGIGLCGVAPSTQILPIRLVNSAGTGITSKQINTAISWAVSKGAKVINMSFGSVTPSSAGVSLPLEYTTSVALTMWQAYLDGVSVVNSAGNNGTNLNNYSYSNYSASVVVGGLHADTNLDAVTPYSTSWGSRVDIAAGSTGIRTSEGLALYGTSFAAPQVAGAIAFLYGIDAGMTPANVRSLLVAGSDVCPTNFVSGTSGPLKSLGLLMDDPVHNATLNGARVLDTNSLLQMAWYASLGNRTGIAVRVFNSDDVTQVKLTPASWATPYLSAAKRIELITGTGNNANWSYDFRSTNTSSGRTFGYSIFGYKSGVGVEKTYTGGDVRRYGPDGASVSSNRYIDSVVNTSYNTTLSI